VIVISKTIEFSASHQLKRLAPEHQCARLHGHNYTVEIDLRGYELDQFNMLVDYGVLSSVIKTRFEHRHLNDDADLGDQPTAELLASLIAQIISAQLLAPLNVERGAGAEITVTRVRVSETASSWAEWRA